MRRLMRIAAAALVAATTMTCKSPPEAAPTEVAPAAVDVGVETGVDDGERDERRDTSPASDEVYEIGLDETATSRDGLSVTWIGRRHKHAAKYTMGYREFQFSGEEEPREFSSRGGTKLHAQGRTGETTWTIDGVDYDTVKVTFLADAPAPLSEEAAAAIARERADETTDRIRGWGRTVRDGVLHATYRTQSGEVLLEVSVGLFTHHVTVAEPMARERPDE